MKRPAEDEGHASFNYFWKPGNNEMGLGNRSGSSQFVRVEKVYFPDA